MLLVAPAGYGKTTLARQWLRDRSHVWYAATSASSDVAGLALGFASTAASVVEGVGDHLRGRLKTVGDPAAEARSLAADLARDLSTWPESVRFVIDDYHLVAESGAAEAFVAELVHHTRVPLLVNSRSRPSWVTTKSLLYGEVVELGRNVLAMTHSEAAEALAHTHDEMPGLVALAEGWPAVIGLVAAVPYTLPEEVLEIPETLHQYFAEELYEAVPTDARWTAVQLSLGPTIRDSVVRTLLGRRAKAVLDEAHENGFLTKSAGSFEMHPLVRQFLRTKLPDFEPEDIRSAAEAIANAYAEASLWDEAASVATDFELTEVSLRVLTDALEGLLSEGRLTTLSRWLEGLRGSAPTAPIVQLAGIEIDFRKGDWSSASAKAQQLARTIRADDRLASRVYLRAGQMAHLDDRHDDALELLTAAKTQAQSPTDLRSALWTRFMTLCDLEAQTEAEAALVELEAHPPSTADDVLRAAQGRLQLAGRWGPLVETLESVSGVIAFVDQSNDPLIRTGFMQTYGAALDLAARYDEARDIADREIEDAERFKLEWVLPHALEVRAAAQTGMRDFDAALKTIATARRLAALQQNVHTEVNGLVIAARAHLCLGSPERAVELLDGREARFTSTGLEGEYLATRGFALACCGRADEAISLIEASEAVSTQVDALTIRAFGLFIAASINGPAPDRDLLSHAIVTTSATGNFDAFVCAYRAFPALLKELRSLEESAAEFVQIACSLDPGLAEKAGFRPGTKVRKSHEPLTRREREVLSLLQRGLSNREIARTLWITESTVKVHVRHVFAKMGVRSRTEAVALSLDPD